MPYPSSDEHSLAIASLVGDGIVFPQASRAYESTARGVALFAGLQAGVVTDIDDLVRRRGEGASLFEPQMDTSRRVAWRARWNDAVTRSLGWHG